MVPAEPALCRLDGHTCGGCCWGENLTRASLAARLRRQSALFRRWFSERPPTPLVLACYEVVARGGLDLLLAVLLWIPLLGEVLRPWLRRRLACAFLGFEDRAGSRVACLLHPTRWGGAERRPAAAFRLLRGLGCGAPDYLCQGALAFRRAAWEDRARFRRDTGSLDWHEYSKAAPAFLPTTPSRAHMPCETT
jgi:hypothetical protein